MGTHKHYFELPKQKFCWLSGGFRLNYSETVKENNPWFIDSV